MLEMQIFISQISGIQSVTIGIIVLGIFLIIRKKFLELSLIMISVNLSLFLTLVTKKLFHIPRPDEMLIEEISYRFPSSHATAAASIATLIVYFASLNVKSKNLRYLIYVLAFSWYLLVSYSRIYLHAHIFIDVLVGGIVGLLATISVLKFLYK